MDPMGRSDKRALRVPMALPVLAALSAKRARPEYKELRVPLVRSELRDRWGVQAPKAFLDRPAALDRLPAPLALLARKGRWETRGSKDLLVFKAASERPDQLAPSEARASLAQDRPA